jgi:hypothetical protein
MNIPGIKINLDEIITIYSSEDYLINLLVVNPDNYIIVSRETSDISDVSIAQKGLTLIQISNLKERIKEYCTVLNTSPSHWRIEVNLNKQQKWLEETFYYAVIISIHKILKQEIKLKNIPDYNIRKDNQSIKEILFNGGMRITTGETTHKRLPIPAASYPLKISKNKSKGPVKANQNIANLLIGIYTFDMELIKKFGNPHHWQTFIKQNEIEDLIINVSRETLIIGENDENYTIIFTDKYTREVFYQTLTKKGIESEIKEINKEGLTLQ